MYKKKIAEEEKGLNIKYQISKDDLVYSPEKNDN